MQKYEMAAALARQLNVSELTTADCDWIIEAARRGIMESEEEAGILIGYMLGLGNISPSNSLDQVAAPSTREPRPVIRPAASDDVPAIAELIRALAEYERLGHEVEWDEAQLEATLFGPDAVPRTTVAVDDASGEVVGMAIWYRTYSTFQGRPGIWLEDLFVQPEHRGAGHGRALLQSLFDQADGGRVEWAVLDWNEPSIRFYDSLGATPVEGWTRYRWMRTPH